MIFTELICFHFCFFWSFYRVFFFCLMFNWSALQKLQSSSKLFFASNVPGGDDDEDDDDGGDDDGVDVDGSVAGVADADGGRPHQQQQTGRPLPKNDAPPRRLRENGRGTVFFFCTRFSHFRFTNKNKTNQTTASAKMGTNYRIRRSIVSSRTDILRRIAFFPHCWPIRDDLEGTARFRVLSLVPSRTISNQGVVRMDAPRNTLA